MLSGIQRTEKEALAYCAEMESIHKCKWLAFHLPADSKAREFGEFAACRESERADYEAGGAVFIGGGSSN